MDDTTLNRAIVYRRSGRDAEAEQVLRNALAEQEEQQGNRPTDPVPFRNAGRILLLLGDGDAARTSLEAAAELDVARLQRTTNGPDEWTARWSLGKTYHAMGYRDAALDEIVRAQEVAPDDTIRSEISRWFAWEERRGRLVETNESVLQSVAIAR
jgi:Flp pilus assembly protein TadD